MECFCTPYLHPQITKVSNEFDCISVHSAPRHGCRSGGVPPPVVTQPEGILASVVTVESECGSHHSPWRLEASPGQQFNFTLVDFAHHVLPSTSGPSRDDSPTQTKSASGSGGRVPPSAGVGPASVCYAYAVFRESGPEGVSKTHTQCGSLNGERESVAYTSTTNKVTVTIISGRAGQEDTARHFLIKYSGWFSR